MRHCQHLEFVLTGAIKEITRPWEGVDPPTLPVGFPGFPPSPDHAVAVEAAGEEGRGGHLDGDSLRMQAAVLLQVDWRQAEGGGEVRPVCTNGKACPCNRSTIPSRICHQDTAPVVIAFATSVLA